MTYYIETMYDNGSGMKYNTKEALLNESSRIIDDYIANDGTYIDY